MGTRSSPIHFSPTPVSPPLIRLLRQALPPPLRNVALSEPLARLDQLDDVDDLLAGHDREGHGGENPRDSAVHLVGAGHLHGAGGPRAGEEERRLGRGGRPGRQAGRRLRVLQQRRREERRRERQQVQRDEEELVQRAEGEEDFL